jgi:hypothetical protein
MTQNIQPLSRRYTRVQLHNVILQATCTFVNWIYLAHTRDDFQALASAVTNYGVPHKVGNLR